MAFHPDITRKDDVTLAMDTANAAVRIASRQLTGNAGTVEIPNVDGTSTIMGVGAGDTGVAPWVGDTTAPGKPLGITAESHNGAIWVSWDGTLDGGVPADFDHVRFTAVDGSKTVDMGQLKAAGKVTAAELTAGDTVTITAIAYDDAHDSTGASTPNASAASTPVTVVVQSAVDASVVRKAQDDAQSALDKAGRAVDTATASKQASEGAKADAANAVNTANSANDTSANASSTAKQALSAAQSAQKDGVTHYVPQYAQNTDPKTAPKTGWSEKAPDWVAGSYIWSRMIVAYGSGDYETTAPVVVTGNTGEPGKQGDPGKDGKDGTSVAIKGRVSTSFNLPPSASDGDGYITEDTGHLWVWGSHGFTDVGKIQGDNGLSAYAHKAYSNSADGVTDFSTTNGSNRIYMGWYTDNTLADSSDTHKYTWTKVKGDDGVKGVSVATVTPYWALGTVAPAQPAVPTPPSPWVSSEPGYQRNQNLYTTTKFTYDSGAFVYTNVQLDSSYQYSAAAETAARDALQTATNANTAADTAKKAAANANSAATSATTKAETASSAATQAQATSTAAAQAATSAQTAANLAIANAPNYIKNPQFHGSNLDSVRTTQMDASDSNAGTLPAAASTYGKNTGGYDCIADAVRIRAIAGHTYRIEIDSRPASDMPSTETEPFGLMYWCMSADNPGITANQYTIINTTATTVTDWTHSKMEFTYAGTEPWSVFRPAYRANPVQKWLVTNFACTDVTDAKAAQDAAATAQTAADNAATAAANAASIANTAKAAAQGAQTTADGKNKIFSAASEPAHTGLVPGDLWFQLDSSKHVTGIQTWNGSRFVDYLVVANEILVAGSVGTTQIANGAITTDLLTSNAVTAIKIAAQTITGDKLNVGSVASAIMTSNLFKTSGTSDYTIVNDSGVTVYKDGKAYTHLGSDTTYGLQAWNPITSNLTDISSMVFGASSIVESNDVVTATVGVVPKTQNVTPWKDLDVIQENGSWKRFRSPSGRFLVVMTIGYRGVAPRDFVYMYANVNFRKNNGAISVTNDYSATSTPGSSTYNMFTPGTFIGIIVVEPNVDYSVNMSFKTIHYNFSDNGIYAYGHCNYRRLFIMPV
ncbi:hypothetical protein [Bifidobacterium mongoliense]|uniref:hypothetical protein n=1 Tax=Bifidobacterium mongoliense TaxID=518643 RepID=UPI0030EC9866